MEDLTGKQLGAYQVTAPLGEGGMAAVYKAYQPAMDRYVALKILPRHFASDPEFVKRFQQEARVLAKLQHPHILPVFDFGEADGYTYLVMPFIKSGTLTQLMHGHPFNWPQIRVIISQIGDALDYAHAQGLIHRDVKPSNVLIDERANCLLTDFGLAKIVEGSLHLTSSGAVMGTPAYMSPEQGLGQRIDARSDIYALGVILYELATGRAPYQAETPMAVMIKHINDPLPPPSTVSGVIPEAIERVILKALAKNPDDRFATAGEMVKAVQAALPDGTGTLTPLVTESISPATQPPAPTTSPAPVDSAPPSIAPHPSVPPTALRGSIVISVIGWGVGIVLGLAIGSSVPWLGGLLAGAFGGLTLSLAWNRLAPDLVRRRQFLALMGWWALCGAGAWSLGALFFLPLTLGGWLTGRVIRKAEPGFTHKQTFILALGWGGSWLVAGIVIAIASNIAPWLAASLGAVSLIFVPAFATRLTLRQWQKARSAGGV